jgi:hypothetical protein
MNKPLRLAVSAIGLLVLVFLTAVVCYYFFAEHKMYYTVDSEAGLTFSATCSFDQLSYRTYITMRTLNGRFISRSEIPFSADMLSDCMDQDYYRIQSIVLDRSHSVAVVHFVDHRREPVRLPLLIEGIDH